MSLQSPQHRPDTSSVVAAAFPTQPPRSVVRTVEQFAERNPAFTAPALRNLIFKAKTRQSSKGEIAGNGLLECGAILRVGRRVLIDEDRFFDWVRGQSGITPRVTVETTTPQRLRRRQRSPDPVCQLCGGSGTDPNTDDVCDRCQGSGWEPRGD